MSQGVIKPSNGRIVLFTPDQTFEGAWRDINQPLAAMVCHVWTDRMVNLTVTDSDGWKHALQSVPLVQPGDEGKQYEGRYCEWMPYQLGQAAKTEAAEARTEQVAKHVAEINPPERNCSNCGSPQWCSPTCHLDGQPKTPMQPGANIHGIGPDTDGGPNPDYRGDNEKAGRTCDCGGPGICTCGKA